MSSPTHHERKRYRIVQVTNAARHGRGPVTLRVDVPPDGLEIELVNGLAGATGPPRDGRGRVAASRGGGRGLDGMRERVLLLGGRITAGPADGRWLVRVQLPTPRGEPR